jgi:hypothetical protein
VSEQQAPRTGENEPHITGGTEAKDERPPEGTPVNTEVQEKATLWSFASFIEKVVLILITFGLTTILGTELTERYKKASASKEFEIAAMSSDLSRSVTTFEDISRALDERLFRMRQLSDVFDGSISDDALTDRRLEYRKVFLSWNDNLNRRAALFDFYFGQPRKIGQDAVVGNCYESFYAVADKFRSAHQSLQRLIDKRPDSSVSILKSELDEINVCNYFLDQFMLTKMMSQRATHRERIISSD